MTLLDSLQNKLWQAVGNPETIAFTAIRVALVFVVVLRLLKVSGKRVLGQFTPFDLVALLLISNVVQSAMIGPDTSVVGGLLGAAIILVLNRLVSNDDRLRQFLEGSPTLLVENGRMLEDNLLRERISSEGMQSALSEHGVAVIADVASAVLETDGTVKRSRTVRSSRNR